MTVECGLKRGTPALKGGSRMRTNVERGGRRS